ncbi:peptidoglycan-binding protein [Streptomyces sp. ISL-36]|uniref:peptidoglycan-binding domain-containing protein n=1 Tax=Streptomyces sp. ISL-36 TaxID=2819182 RepID=UPI002035A5A2|nr:peptidoglycan-binding domain-containing protein [Streptomyces sp. ISL-36]
MPLLLQGVVGWPDDHAPVEPERPATRRRGTLVALAAAVAVAVVGTAALAAGLLDGGDDMEDRAAVPTVTTSASENVAVFEAPTSTPSASSATPSSSASASASSSASRPASPSPSPTAVRTTAATSGAPAGPPSPSADLSGPGPSSTPSQDDEGPAEGPTLRRGDSGPEVAELQRRLREVGAYEGPVNGEYGRKVEDAVARYQSDMDIDEDPRGVYGSQTRRSLEAETSD